MVLLAVGLGVECLHLKSLNKEMAIVLWLIHVESRLLFFQTICKALWRKKFAPAAILCREPPISAFTPGLEVFLCLR